eukprot:EG_transcript_10593
MANVPTFSMQPQVLSGPMLRLLHPIPTHGSIPFQPNSPVHTHSPGSLPGLRFVPALPTPTPTPAATKVFRPIPAPVDIVRRLSNPPSLPLTPKSPHLTNNMSAPRGLLRDTPTPPGFDPELQASLLQTLLKNLRGAAPSLTPVRHLSDPMPSRVPCKACGISFCTEADLELHQASKEHKKRHHDREQRAVLVTGLPDNVTEHIVTSIFQGFELRGDAVEYVTESKAQQPFEPHWHVLLRDVDEARRAAKMSPLAVAGHAVAIALAVQPHHCAVCNVTVNSATQLQQHMVGARHLEVLKQQQAAFSLTVLSVPATASETQIVQLFQGFDIAEGGISFEADETDAGSKAAHVAFASKEAWEGAASLAEASPEICGQPVQVVCKQGSSPAPKLEVPKSGLKTAKEVHMLVCSLLYAHRITDASEVTTHLFSRIHSTFLSCKPYAFAPFRPRDRFFAEFEAQAGSRRGLIPLEETFAILRQMDRDWSFELPAGVVQWLEAK